jgi:predicted DNA-binding transcriptional regulator YafY
MFAIDPSTGPLSDLRYDLPMGQRSATQTVAAVMVALMEKRTWTQAALARRAGLERPEALRNVLRELQESGVPLESEKEHPHVYWSVPKDWYPGGVLFVAEHVPELLRQLSRLPKSKARDKLLALVMEQLPGRGKTTPAAPIVARPSSENEEQYIPIIEDAAAKGVALWMRYLTASRGGKVSERHASVHVVEIGPPARFIATCHKNGDLRWFRVESVLRARPDDSEVFRVVDPGALATFRAESLDGYKGPGPAVACSFFVREPESSWVVNNLLDGMRVETLHGGIRVSLETSAMVRLARYVVSLGDAAQPETEALASAVIELARGALEQASLVVRQREDAAASQGIPATPARPRSDV